MRGFLPIPSGLIELPLKLTRQSIDPAANRYRYYILRVDSAHGILFHGPEDLWGNPCVARRWGRIGAESLRERYVWPASSAHGILFHGPEAELERWVRHVCRACEDHGYELILRSI